MPKLCRHRLVEVHSLGQRFGGLQALLQAPRGLPFLLPLLEHSPHCGLSIVAHGIAGGQVGAQFGDLLNLLAPRGEQVLLRLRQFFLALHELVPQLLILLCLAVQVQGAVLGGLAGFFYLSVRCGDHCLELLAIAFFARDERPQLGRLGFQLGNLVGATQNAGLLRIDLRAAESLLHVMAALSREPIVFGLQGRALLRQLDDIGPRLLQVRFCLAQLELEQSDRAVLLFAGG
mmetsp:Transcript_22255/g.63662  ORF Transcript_22255/g.63662 Transcript_22255/m.63662 type:complete len:232 (-) Transcript_22255:103-798(-)